MATTRIGGLNVILSAVTGPFDTAMKKSAKGVKSFGSTVAGVAGKVAKYGAALTAVALGGLAVFVAASLKSIDTTAKLSAELGISTEALSAYKLQADLTGTSIEDVTGAVQKMQKNIGDAGAGIGTATQGFTQMGISLEQIQALSPEKQFELISDSLSQIDDVTKRASAGAAIFGGKYKKIASLIDQGSEGFRRAREETEKLGTALSAIDAKQVEQANDAMRMVGETFKGFIQQITVRLAPIITAVSVMLRNAAGSANDWGSAMDGAISFSIKAVEFLIDTWSGLIIVFNLGKIALAEIGIVGNKAINGLAKSFQFIGALGAGVWESATTSVQLFGQFVGFILNNIKLGFALFVQTAGASLAVLLNGAADVARNVKGLGDIAVGLQSAAGQITAKTGGLAQNVRLQIKAAGEETDILAAKSVAASQKIKDLVTGNGPAQEGSQDAVARIALLEQMKQDAIAVVIAESTAIAQESALTSELKFEITKATQAAEIAAQIAEEKLGQSLTSEEIRQSAILSQQETFNAKLLANEKATVDKNVQLWKSGLKGRLQITGSILGQLGSLMQSKSRKAFEVGKAAAISEAVINTSLAGIKAYQAMVGIPVVGPSLAVAAAGAAVAAGVVQVQNIKSTSFGGGSVASSGAGGGGGGAASATAPEGVSGAGGVTPPPALELVIDDSSGGMIDGRRLVELINDAQADGALISSVRLA